MISSTFSWGEKNIWVAKVPSACLNIIFKSFELSTLFLFLDDLLREANRPLGSLYIFPCLYFFLGLFSSLFNRILQMELLVELEY